VFGPRQDPNGAYAAVIPRFIAALMKNEAPVLYGDGEQSRDFCFVENACHANWLALQAPAANCDGMPMNIACGQRISLNGILALIQKRLNTRIKPVFHPERMGDVRHSLADLSRAKEKIGYEPRVFVEEGLNRTVDWFLKG
jgi:nucleoside-diphosphate-sugar epimerase